MTSTIGLHQSSKTVSVYLPSNDYANIRVIVGLRGNLCARRVGKLTNPTFQLNRSCRTISSLCALHSLNWLVVPRKRFIQVDSGRRIQWINTTWWCIIIIIVVGVVVIVTVYPWEALCCNDNGRYVTGEELPKVDFFWLYNSTIPPSHVPCKLSANLIHLALFIESPCTLFHHQPTALITCALYRRRTPEILRSRNRFFSQNVLLPITRSGVSHFVCSHSNASHIFCSK